MHTWGKSHSDQWSNLLPSDVHPSGAITTKSARVSLIKSPKSSVIKIFLLKNTLRILAEFSMKMFWMKVGWQNMNEPNWYYKMHPPFVVEHVSADFYGKSSLLVFGFVFLDGQNIMSISLFLFAKIIFMHISWNSICWKQNDLTKH